MNSQPKDLIIFGNHILSQSSNILPFATSIFYPSSAEFNTTNKSLLGKRLAFNEKSVGKHLKNFILPNIILLKNK